ncbi:tetratricopeptide repeat protein [Pseudemcibacter aquimaris]|uniref:tetratricopeptide repeat protein n=1 Tax=Pseudemcibacter aquimaris TaxID=2857064 RepID=UPI002012E222|nr:tetratricopeptide repeat protein [Pseudemcibacter aquimaris]MCC3859840.1 sel1 repeat family protein [Pseudemcibacter aquimaris]WDU57172.1 sel1 repeat family protein [Pseudemcibacter aquimaris]
MHFKRVFIIWGTVFAQIAYADIDRGKEAYFMGEYERAIEEFTEDANKGNSYAQIKLGFMHENGWGAPKNYDMAREYYIAASSNGNSDGYIHLAKLFAYGRGVEKDAELAKAHLLRAASMGEPHAFYVLGEIFNDNYALGENAEEALKYYLMAAENDAAASLINGRYRPGNGQWFRLITEEGVKLTENFAETGNQYAQFNAGLRYHFGEGVMKDYEKAEKFFLMAANQGNVEAQKFVAQNRALNPNGNSDLVFIDTWLTIASRGGDHESTRNKEKLESSMTADQIITAEKQADEWLSKNAG